MGAYWTYVNERAQEATMQLGRMGGEEPSMAFRPDL